MKYKIEENLENLTGCEFFVYERLSLSGEWGYLAKILVHAGMSDEDVIERAKATLKQPRALYFEA